MSTLAALALIVTAVNFDRRAGCVPRPTPNEPRVGKAAPDFTLKTLDGKKAKLSDMKGKVVLVDFWATWCPPCRKSLPHVQEMSQDKAMADNGLVVWAVNAHEDKAKVEPFMKQNKFTFNVPMDAQGAAMQKYHVSGIPTTIVVGRDGKVKKAFVGYGNGQRGA